MIPLKETTAPERLVPAAAVLVVLQIALAFVFPGELAVGLVVANTYILWLLVPPLSARWGSGWLLVLSALSTGVGVALGSAFNGDLFASGSLAVLALVQGGYLLRQPTGRVLSVSVIPPFVGLREVPTVLLVGIWIALQAIV